MDKNGNTSLPGLESGSHFPLLRLPPEIVLLITRHLKPQYRFFLAQTCTVLRALAWCNVKKELARVSFVEEFEAWQAIAYHSPNHWACVNCVRLHAVDTSDTPLNRQHQCGYSLDDSRPRRRRLSSSSSVEYDFQDHHAQLALKFDHLGNVHGEYLRRLLASHTTQSQINEYLTRTSYMHPMIINRRLILHKVQVYENTVLPITDDTIENDSPRICPHVSSKPLDGVSVEDIRSISSEYALYEAFVLFPGQEILLHCPLCSTDYSFQATGKHEFVLRVWHDFGAHITYLRSWERTCRTFWDYPVENWSEHEPGSIRELYLTGGQ
ncbi:F-box domain containing [Fusarium albosuccineum]|uniref:F-box domain containing n=1 Tax=Fusarium albosuccineum TaxID=1237068 RepID=A0A8H4LAG1_9HYPO|nr:F-box domain containing [Fusarium albosuccineum]